MGDVEIVRDALEHALTYPRKNVLGQEGYDQAHAELQKALEALTRINRKLKSAGRGESYERVSGRSTRLR